MTEWYRGKVKCPDNPYPGRTRNVFIMLLASVSRLPHSIIVIVWTLTLGKSEGEPGYDIDITMSEDNIEKATEGLEPR